MAQNQASERASKQVLCFYQKECSLATSKNGFIFLQISPNKSLPTSQSVSEAKNSGPMTTITAEAGRVVAEPAATKLPYLVSHWLRNFRHSPNGLSKLEHSRQSAFS